ncbi:hypothetical protein CKAH01_06026 [Colletotrichum kahawae]|uniref:Uncharacterized protein n=1 Tax=Colletotrichum kahawae TaxID=34407 RepID=A0AAE0D3H6_COLKA|nr:hypothetical protein CKAH01_06026 [Colletotrichum kahawae]
MSPNNGEQEGRSHPEIPQTVSTPSSPHEGVGRGWPSGLGHGSHVVDIPRPEGHPTSGRRWTKRPPNFLSTPVRDLLDSPGAHISHSAGVVDPACRECHPGADGRGGSLASAKLVIGTFPLSDPQGDGWLPERWATFVRPLAAACLTEVAFIRSTTADGHKPRALLLAGYPREAARLLSSPYPAAQLTRKGERHNSMATLEAGFGSFSVQLPMSLIAARSQWGLSHADWRSVKDQQKHPCPPFDQDSPSSFSELENASGLLTRLHSGVPNDRTVSEALNPLRDGMGQEDDSVQGHEQRCESASLTHQHSAPTPGGRPGSAVFVPDVRCAPLSLRRGVLAIDRRQHDSCLRTTLSASSATACLSMDEDYGWSHSLDAIAGKANGAVRYDMAPDELRREATGGDGQVNAEALCVARQELMLPLQYLAHLTLHGADVHLRLLHYALPTAEGPEKCVWPSTLMHSSQEAQGDTGGRSTQLVRRSGEWRPGWAMSKLQTVPIPTRLVFFK